MAGTVIFYCPDSNGSDLTDVSNTTQQRWRCEPEGNDAEQKPTVLDVVAYCNLAETDCSGVASETGDGPQITDPADFAILSGWIMFIFAIGFGVRAIRKTISSRL